MYPKANIDSPKLIEFLDGLHRQIEGPVTLVWDNLRAHHSKLVQRYLCDNDDWLQIVYLPPYCPELNPIEYVWSSWKRTYLANYCPKNTDQLCDLLMDNEDALTDHKLLQGCLLASNIIQKEDLTN
jgi:transposase